jgi:hypothetical protein
VRFEVFMAVRIMFFWVWNCVDSSVDANVSEKHTISILRAEVAKMRSGRIYKKVTGREG